MLLIQAVSAFAALRLERLHLIPGLLHGAGHEPAYGVLLPAHGLHDLGKSGPALALEHRNHLGGFAVFTRRGSFHRLGCFFALGRWLGWAGLLGRLALAECNLGGLCASFGLLGGLRLR